MKRKLKLFVWTDYAPDHTGGLAVAIAETEGEARRLVEKKHGYTASTWGNLAVYRLDQRRAFCVPGGG